MRNIFPTPFPTPWQLYVADYFSLATTTIVAVCFFFPFFELEISKVFAAAILGYAFQIYKRISDKNDLRKAILSDIAAIVTLLHLISEIEYKIMNPNLSVALVQRARDVDNKMSQVENTGLRPATRHMLEQLTIFSSQENYFAFIDSLGVCFSDLPAPDDVRRFYTLLRGSRDALRLRVRWRLGVFDQNPDFEELKREMLDSAVLAAKISLQLVEAAQKAICCNSVAKERVDGKYKKVLGTLETLHDAAKYITDKEIEAFDWPKPIAR